MLKQEDNPMRIKRVYEEGIIFDNGATLESFHDQDCCESHYADFSSIIGQGWEDKDFPENLSSLIVKSEIPDEKTNDYGDVWRSFFQIQDKQGNKYTLTIYNSNNGYYGTGVALILTNGKFIEKYTVQ